MARTALFDGVTGDVTPSSGVNTLTVVDWDTPIAIGAEFGDSGDSLEVVQLMEDTTSFEGFTCDNELVILNNTNRQVVLITPGVYGLRGVTRAATTGYKIEL